MSATAGRETAAPRTEGTDMPDTDTQAAVTLGTLTADDIAALLTADDVTLHHYQGKGHIRAYLRSYGGDGRIYTAREQRLFRVERDSSERIREIPVVSAGYGYNGTTGGPWNFSDQSSVACFVWTNKDIIRSLAKIARPGAIVSLRWIADNNNQNHEKVDYHQDEVYAELSHKKDTLRILLATQVGPDNSARMIRRYGS